MKFEAPVLHFSVIGIRSSGAPPFFEPHVMRDLVLGLHFHCSVPIGAMVGPEVPDWRPSSQRTVRTGL